MWNRSIGLGLLAALIGGLAGGCKKSAPRPSLLPPAPVETVAAVRWLGKARLAADTNAAALMEIWNLAESKKLEAQTLDKLAVGLVASNQLSVISNQVSATGHQSPPPTIHHSSLAPPLCSARYWMIWSSRKPSSRCARRPISRASWPSPSG